MKQNKTKKINDNNNFKIRSLADLNDENNEQNNDFNEEGHKSNLELEYYMLLSHKSAITGFKLLLPDLYESFKNTIPTVVTTITEHSWIYLWYENLMDATMSFMCAHVFKPAHNDLINDVAFLDFPPINPEKYHEIKEKESRIFNPEKYKLKIHNKLGIYQNTYDGLTYDWIFILKSSSFDLYRAEGLRNFPIKNINIALKMEITFSQKFLPRVHPPDKIVSISMRDFNDKISFYGINKSSQLIKFRKNISTSKSDKNEWHFRNILMLKQDNVTDILVHTDYPISMNKTFANELQFYFEEQSNHFSWSIHKSIKFIGQYSHNKDIKQIKFINKIPGVLILNTDGTMTIVCSDTFLKVLGSHKYSKEFLEIWNTKRNNAYEKWVLVDEYTC